MDSPLRVLFIEDSDNNIALQVRLLERAGFKIEYLRVDAPKELVRALNQKWDLIISDYSMPHFTGTEALKIVRDQGLDLPFIFVSGTLGEDTAVAALKAGAQDCLAKVNLSRLVPSVERELREAAERRWVRRLEEQVHQLQRFEAVGRLAGGVAHDFNNVIGAIMGWAEIGQDEAEPASRIQQRFFKIRSQAERAVGPTRQLLAFARRQLLQPCNTYVNGLVREAVALLRNIIGERVEVDLQLTPNLCVAWADLSQVEQILMNLCLNTRVAIPRGGKLSIEMSHVELDADFQRTHAAAVLGDT